MQNRIHHRAAAWRILSNSAICCLDPQSRGSFYPTHLPKLELFSGYGTPFFPRRAASAHMTKSLALDPHDLSSRGDLLPSRAGIPPRVASIIWNRNFPSLLSDPSTHGRCGTTGIGTYSRTTATTAVPVPQLHTTAEPQSALIPLRDYAKSVKERSLEAWCWLCGWRLYECRDVTTERVPVDVKKYKSTIG